MSIMNYWPSVENITDCIRKEAEELAEHALLAVHEPMRFIKRDMSGQSSIGTESDLLETFLKIDRPIPIIGASGVGKSHIIRWLNAQLKALRRTENWHIVRVSKNASLQQVLHTLLSGLEGDNFDQARSKITSVGETLKPLELAQLLLTFMRQQLRDIHRDTEAEIDRYRIAGTKPTPEEQSRLAVLKTHTGEQGLGTLINDPYFQGLLLNEEGCFYKIAKRWVEGANDDEAGNQDYQVHASDLSFEYDVSSLSINARMYVNNARLNTAPKALEDAVGILNEVMGRSNQKAFATLFSFNNGSFQDLFKEIRRQLHQQGRTLVILVEDMAAISAIEDVLIDSLLEEGMRDGENAMCAVRSAIAVTEGYRGYVRRQGTILTRATAEWVIVERMDSQIDDESQVVDRMVDFCSRYINAARHGVINLKSTSKVGQVIENWTDASADTEHLDAFGYSKVTDIALFPLSRLSIQALAYKHCVNDNVLKFNPRLIINKILLPILKEGRLLAEQGRFPPTMLADIIPHPTLHSEIRRLNLEWPERAATLAAIWGFGARDFAQLRNKLSASIAKAFNLLDLANHLDENVAPQEVQNEPLVYARHEVPVITSNVGMSLSKPLVDNPFEKTEFELERWFKGEEGLPQNTANALRIAINNVLEIYVQPERFGVNKIPSLRSGNNTKIIIPFPQTRGNNKADWHIEFCSEDDLKDKKVSVFNVAKALLRHQLMNKSYADVGWNYSHGRQDFMHVQNFAQHWVPITCKKLIERERQTHLKQKLTDHVQIAWQIGAFNQSDSVQEKLNKLLLESSKLVNRKGITPYLQEILERQLTAWDTARSDWLDLVATNDYGLDGWVVKPLLNEVLKSQPVRQLVVNFNQAKKDLAPLMAVVSSLEDFSSSEAFASMLLQLEQTVRELLRSGDYPQVEGLKTSQTFGKYISELRDGGCFSTVTSLLKLNEEQDPVKFWQIVYDINPEKVELIQRVIVNWSILFNTTYQKLLSHNKEFGGEEIRDIAISIDKELQSLEVNASAVRRIFNENT